MRVLSLCSGVGMHDLGLRTAFNARTVCYLEREAYPASQLVALMEAGFLDAAPVWSDLATFNATPWRGIVDAVVAGLPCQPYSAAGKQLGNRDYRGFGRARKGPIAQFLRIVADCRPAVVFLENVPAWVTRGWFRPVGAELCRLGYEIERPLFLAAQDVGASHKRERVWILAYEPGRGQRVLRESSRFYGQPDGGGEQLADAGRSEQAGHDHAIQRQHEGRALPENGIGDMALAAIGGRERCWLYEPARRIGDVDAGRCVGAVADAEGWRGGLRQRDELPRRAEADFDGGQRDGQRISATPRAGRESGAEGSGEALGHPESTRLARGGQATMRADGKSRMDMLDWQAETFSLPDPETNDGPESLDDGNGSRPRLNTAFTAWLMGLPWWWTNPGVTSCARSEMAAYRSALRSRLQSLLGESPHE